MKDRVRIYKKQQQEKKKFTSYIGKLIRLSVQFSAEILGQEKMEYNIQYTKRTKLQFKNTLFSEVVLRK